MVRVSDGEMGTTTGDCSEVVDGCSSCCCCWVSSSTALDTRNLRFLIGWAFNGEMRGRRGKEQKATEGEENEAEGIVVGERRIEWRDEEDENSVAIFETLPTRLVSFALILISPYLSYPKYDAFFKNRK